MENASKALIIAGAILLAILLISLGIMIFTQAQDTINTSGMSQTEMQSFNNKFLKYEGDTVKGAEVKALVNEVIASNSDSNNEIRKVSVYYYASDATASGKIIAGPGINGTNTSNTTSDIDNSGTYKVNALYAQTDQPTTWHTTKGCIYRINITKNNS